MKTCKVEKVLLCVYFIVFIICIYLPRYKFDQCLCVRYVFMFVYFSETIVATAVKLRPATPLILKNALKGSIYFEDHLIGTLLIPYFLLHYMALMTESERWQWISCHGLPREYYKVILFLKVHLTGAPLITLFLPHLTHSYVYWLNYDQCQCLADFQK